MDRLIDREPGRVLVIDGCIHLVVGHHPLDLLLVTFVSASRWAIVHAASNYAVEDAFSSAVRSFTVEGAAP